MKLVMVLSKVYTSKIHKLQNGLCHYQLLHSVFSYYLLGRVLASKENFGDGVHRSTSVASDVNPKTMQKTCHKNGKGNLMVIMYEQSKHAVLKHSFSK